MVATLDNVAFLPCMWQHNCENFSILGNSVAFMLDSNHFHFANDGKHRKREQLAENCGEIYLFGRVSN